MATSFSTVAERIHMLSVRRLLIAGALTGVVVYVLCWIGTFIPFSGPPHSYISLFTNADVSSGRALVEGSLWSLLFGGLSGALFAVIYNATGSASVARPDTMAD